MISPLATKLTDKRKKELKTIEQRLTDFLEVKKAPQGQINAAYKTFEKAAITPSAAGTGFVGTPIVAPDEQNKKKGEMSWNDIETMLAGLHTIISVIRTRLQRRITYGIRLCY